MDSNYKFILFPPESLKKASQIGIASDIFKLNGKNMSDLKSLYEEFASVLKFPDYFGYNMNALYDMLTDLSWLSFNGLYILISDSQDVLSNEDDSVIQGILSLLEDSGQTWSEAIQLGEWWDRPSVPFKVLML